MYHAKKPTQPSSGFAESKFEGLKNSLRIFPRVCAETEIGSLEPSAALHRLPSDTDAHPVEPKRLTFSSKVMVELVEKAKRYARSSAPILITGESGTGKELLCRLIHRESSRAQHNFVAVNCAAMPELLIESELFGHDRGAFTGAFQARLGHFQHAHRGTLLLDEITEIPIAIQAKLLRAIEEQEVLRVGRSTPEKVDTRILATSNRDLCESVKSGHFRMDLYYRVNVLRLHLPPLRDRREDIPGLTEYFLQILRADHNGAKRRFSQAAIKVLCEYDWPGNIRELRNVVHCACIESERDLIEVDSLPVLESWQTNAIESSRSISEVEKALIFASLKKNKGNKSAAAAELGVTARTLSNKLKLYDREQF